MGARTDELFRDDYRGHSIYGVRDPDPGDSVEIRPTAVAESTAGGVFELIGAATASVLAVIGLFGIASLELAIVGTIAVGIALLAQGSTIAARWNHAQHIPATERIEAAGIGTEVMGGFAAVVIGIIAAVGISPFVMLPAAALVLGASLLLGGPAQPALAARATSRRWYVTRDAVRSSGGIMVMAGVAAVVLGILALVGGPVVTLALVAVLCVAAALIVAGGALTARIARRFA